MNHTNLRLLRAEQVSLCGTLYVIPLCCNNLIEGKSLTGEDPHDANAVIPFSTPGKGSLPATQNVLWFVKNNLSYSVILLLVVYNAFSATNRPN